MTLYEWKEDFVLSLRLGKVYVCPAAARFIANPKKAGSKKRYLRGVSSFLASHNLNEELEKFRKLFLTEETQEMVEEVEVVENTELKVEESTVSEEDTEDPVE